MQQEILELTGLRGDGRKYDEMRPFLHNIGLIDYADGSAYLEHGLNKVLAIVKGPHEPRKKSTSDNSDQCNIVCRIMNAPFCGNERKKRKPGDRRVMENEKIMHDVIESIVMSELYPKSEITIIVHVFETDGSTLCTAINAAYLALMNAGISMADMLAACTVGTLQRSSENIAIDLTQQEINNGASYMPLVMKARSEEIVFMQVDNCMTMSTLQDAMEQSTIACRYIKSYLEDAIKSYMNEHLINAN